MPSSCLSTGETNGIKLAVGPSLTEMIPDTMFPQDGGEIPSWEIATELFVSARRGQDETSLKFSGDWTDSVWHHLYEAHKEACFDGCTNFALFAFSGDFLLDDSEQPIPPLNYFKLLQESKEARKKQLDRLLREWGASSHRIRIIGSDPRVKQELNEPIKYYNYDGRFDHHLRSQDHSILGYPRQFLGLYMSEDIPEEELYKVIQSHQNNCPIASKDETIGDSPINNSVIRNYIWKYDGPPLQAKDDESQNVIKMVARRIPTLADKISGIGDIPLRRQKTATVIEAGNWQPYRKSRVKI
jgi:hypothetical protein